MALHATTATTVRRATRASPAPVTAVRRPIWTGMDIPMFSVEETTARTPIPRSGIHRSRSPTSDPTTRKSRTLHGIARMFRRGRRRNSRSPPAISPRTASASPLDRAWRIRSVPTLTPMPVLRRYWIRVSGIWSGPPTTAAWEHWVRRSGTTWSPPVPEFQPSLLLDKKKGSRRNPFQPIEKTIRQGERSWLPGLSALHPSRILHSVLRSRS